MKSRLIWLLERWAEREMIRTLGRATHMPEEAYYWYRDKLGRWHFGSFAGRNLGVFVPHQAAYTLERCTAPRENLCLDEFGVAFRELDDIDQGLIVVAHFGRDDEWQNYLAQIRLSTRRAEGRLSQAWFHLIYECRKRNLV